MFKCYKCFGVCGCGYENTCKHCNSEYFIGYKRQNSVNLTATPPVPNSNSNTCSAQTEYIDVNQKF